VRGRRESARENPPPASPTRFGVRSSPFYFHPRTVELPNGSLFYKIRMSRRQRKKVETTSNGGPLGSCVDEERSKLRYVV
jgi:hypothetical protein